MDCHFLSTPLASHLQQPPRYHQPCDPPPSHKRPPPRPGAPSPPEIQMDGASNEASPKYKQFHQSTRQGHGPQGPRYAILPPTTYSRVNPAGTHSRAAIAAFRARQGKPPPNHPPHAHSHPAPPAVPSHVYGDPNVENLRSLRQAGAHSTAPPRHAASPQP